MQNAQALMVIGVAALVSAGCSKSVEEARPQEVSHPLTPAALGLAAQKGRAIVGEAFQLLSSNLQNAVQQGGISNALPYCSVAALPLTRTIAEREGVTLRRFTHKPRNPLGKADDVERNILKRFEESLLTTNPPAPVTTNTTPGKVTFFAPILLSQPLCLKCHGEPGKDISPNDVALINRLYPQDQARGFKLGELRGAWRVDFPLEKP